jgi:hypothetical protein
VYAENNFFSHPPLHFKLGLGSTLKPIATVFERYLGSIVLRSSFIEALHYNPKRLDHS